jgi:hypothetical protein
VVTRIKAAKGEPKKEARLGSKVRTVRVYSRVRKRKEKDLGLGIIQNVFYGGAWLASRCRREIGG